MRRSTPVLAAFLTVGTDGFSVPSQPLCARATCQRLAAPAMIDSDILIGGVGLLGSMAVGAGFIAFIENQGLKSADNMSDETKSRMAAKFMEDEELSQSYDDTIAKMEAALAAAEGREVDTGDGLTEEEKNAIDTRGWGD